MKIAVVNCRTLPGWVLNVLIDLIQAQLKKHWNLTQIQVFTLISDRDFLEIQIPGSENIAKIPVIQLFPQWLSKLFLDKSRKIPLISSLLDYRNLMPLYPQLMKRLSHKIKSRKPDQILISSFAIAKNIDPIAGIPTTLYLHSPMQYIWSHYQEYVNKFSGIKKRIFQKTAQRLRNRDLKYTKFDTVICNSHYTQSLAKELYNLESAVIYPKIQDIYHLSGISNTPKPYFVCVGRLVNFVRECGLIIKTFNKLGIPLIMIGDGPDATSLKSLAKENIIFTWWLPKEQLIDILKHSAGLINLTKESFGIGTAEALLMGVPVLWYAQGATAELVNQASGLLIWEKNIQELSHALLTFQEKKRDRKLISETFRAHIQSHIKSLDILP